MDKYLIKYIIPIFQMVLPQISTQLVDVMVDAYVDFCAYAEKSDNKYDDLAVLLFEGIMEAFIKDWTALKNRRLKG